MIYDLLFFILLSLTLCFFIHQIAELQIQKSINPGLMEADKFNIGSFVEGEVQDLKDYGVVLGFKDHDAVGFVSQYQCNLFIY